MTHAAPSAAGIDAVRAEDKNFLVSEGTLRGKGPE
jgi:hypothetical protein